MINLRIGESLIVGATLLGYRVMRHKEGKAISGADSRQQFPLKSGQVVRFSGLGIFLSLNKDYVIDHYSVHDENVLLTFKFDPKNITSGNLTDRETEFSVSEAVLKEFELLD